MNTRNLGTILFSFAARADATHAARGMHKAIKIRIAHEARLWQFAGRMTTPVQAALPLKSAVSKLMLFL